MNKTYSLKNKGAYTGSFIFYDFKTVCCLSIASHNLSIDKEQKILHSEIVLKMAIYME